VLAALPLLAACSRLPQPILPPFGLCLPLQTFDQGGDGWYYKELDGTRNSGLWRSGAGLGGTGALVLPPGVDVILRDAPLDLPRENVCFLGRATSATRRAVATVGWLRRGESAACAGDGCFLTQFPPRPPCEARPPGRPEGGPDALGAFALYQFPAANVQGPRCDAAEQSFIAVRHEGEFVIESLGVLVGGSSDCLAVCSGDRECDDGDRCTTDSCVAGRCRNEIACTESPGSVAEIPALSDLGLLLLALLLASGAVRHLRFRDR
jgi:hypothetical protein